MIVAPGPATFFDDVLWDDDLVSPRSRINRPVRDWQEWWRRRAAADPLAAASGFVLTPAEVCARGTSRSQARTAALRGRWVQARRGLVAPIDVSLEPPEHGASHAFERRRHALLASAAMRSRPRDAVAARSAAILHGLPTVSVPHAPELLTVEGSGALGTAHFYAASLDSRETTTWFGCTVTTPARTLVDLGRHDRLDAIMAADAALREDLVTPSTLSRAIDGARGWPGVRQARAVLALADARSESPLESVTRLRILEEDLPAPEIQVWIGPFRVDFFWPRFRLVLEADGRAKYTAEERWKEKRREQALRRRGVLRVERVTWEDVFAGWPVTSAMLRAALR